VQPLAEFDTDLPAGERQAKNIGRVRFGSIPPYDWFADEIWLQNEEGFKNGPFLVFLCLGLIHPFFVRALCAAVIPSLRF
jgi:hypothetical protein